MNACFLCVPLSTQKRNQNLIQWRQINHEFSSTITTPITNRGGKAHQRNKTRLKSLVAAIMMLDAHKKFRMDQTRTLDFANTEKNAKISSGVA
jgi:hypothetical protein